MDVDSVQAFALRKMKVLANEYPFLKNWKVSVDHAKRRAGSCRPLEKVITLSRHHVTHNSLEVVEDTIAHEIAHAVCYELYQDLSHGPRWKKLARTLGAEPKARGKFNLPSAPWVIVYWDCEKERLEKVAERFRRTKGIEYYFVKNKPQTQGKLFYLSSQNYIEYLEGEKTIEQLKLRHSF